MSLLDKLSAAFAPGEALKGRSEPIATSETSFINGRPLKGPYPDGLQLAHFAMGCFWGVERIFWQTDGRVGHGRGLYGRDHPQSHL